MYKCKVEFYFFFRGNVMGNILNNLILLKLEWNRMEWNELGWVRIEQNRIKIEVFGFEFGLIFF